MNKNSFLLGLALCFTLMLGGCSAMGCCSGKSGCGDSKKSCGAEKSCPHKKDCPCEGCRKAASEGKAGSCGATSKKEVM